MLYVPAVVLDGIEYLMGSVFCENGFIVVVEYRVLISWFFSAVMLIESCVVLCWFVILMSSKEPFVPGIVSV